MPVLDALKNLGTGLEAGLEAAAGSPYSLENLQRRKLRQEALSDEERQTGVDLYNQAITGIQQRLGATDPKSTQYTQLQDSLRKAVSGRTMLYHPALSRTGRLQLPGLLAAGAPVAADEYAGLSPEERKKAIKVKHGLEPRAVEPKPEAENWIPTTVKLANGTEVTWQRNTKSGKWSDLAGNPIPPETLSGATVAAKPPTGKPKIAWGKKNGRFFSVQLDENNQFKKGTENFDAIPPASIAGRITEGTYHFVDEKGLIHAVKETRTSVPMTGGAAAPSVPKTPGEAKEKAKAAAGDKIVGFKGTKDYADTKTAYEAAIDRTSTMDQNLTNALQGDQQAMLSLVANHIGMTLGAQRGARITRAVWDEAVESTPWLQRAAARFDERGFLSGVTLAPDQMRQMVRLAHEKVGTLKEHMDRLEKERRASTGEEEAAEEYVRDPKTGKLVKK